MMHVAAVRVCGCQHEPILTADVLNLVKHRGRALNSPLAEAITAAGVGFNTGVSRAELPRLSLTGRARKHRTLHPWTGLRVKGGETIETPWLPQRDG